MRTIRMVVMMALFLSAPCGLMAQGMMGYGGPGMGGYGGQYYEVPESQRGQYESIYNKYKDKLQDIHERMWTKRAEYQALLAAPSVDEKKLEQTASELSKLMTQNHALMTQMRTEMRKAGLSYGASMYGPGMMRWGEGYGMGPGMMGQ